MNGWYYNIDYLDIKDPDIDITNWFRKYYGFRNFINAAAIKCVMCHINYDLS